MKKNLLEERDRAVINKFQSLLRSGMDYDVNSMYIDSGMIAFVTESCASTIINQYYKGIITCEMVDYLRRLEGKHIKKIKLFAEKYQLCERESRLIIRYIKRRLIAER